MPPEQKDESALVARIIEGDDSAFEELSARYLKVIYNFALRMTGNPQNAEDITQEVLIKVWRSIKSFKPEKNFKTWLLSIARNATIDQLRKKKAYAFSDFTNDEGDNALAERLVSEEPEAPELLDRQFEIEELEKALAEINPQAREILLLHYGDELTFDEIGQMLKKPLNTVKSIHRRAVLSLRGILDAPKEAPKT